MERRRCIGQHALDDLGIYSLILRWLLVAVIAALLPSAPARAQTQPMGGGSAGPGIGLVGALTPGNCLTAASAATVEDSGIPCSGGALDLVIDVTALAGGTPSGILYNSANTLGNLATLPSGVLVTDSGGNPSISATLPSGLTLPAPVVTGSFTATGLVTNADLQHPTLTLGSTTLTLGATVTSVSGLTLVSPALSGTVTGNGTIPNAALVNSATTVNGQTCTLGSTCSIVAAATSIQPGVTTITSGTANGLFYDNAGVLGNLATANNGVLVTSGAGAPSISVTLPSGLTAPSLTVTTGFTATGLVTNADLSNPATTVNGQSCVLGATCTVTAAATGIVVGTTTIGSGTSNGLLYDNGGNLGNLATANSSVLVTSSGGVPSLSTTLPSGLSAANFTVTGGFTATGLVTVADLANATTTVNGQACALASTCTITAAATSIAIGTTTITSGTPKGLLFDNGGLVGNLTTSASGVVQTDGSSSPLVSSTLPSGLTIPSAVLTGTVSGTNAIPLTVLANQANNTVLVNVSGGSAGPAAVGVVSCSAASDAINWTINTGFGCNTSITAAAVPGSGVTGALAAIDIGSGLVTSTASATGITAANLKTRFAHIVDCAADYGMAPGNSAATNTTDLGNCLANQYVFIPAGAYAINSKSGGFNLTSGQHVYGAGKGVTILAPADSSNNDFFVVGSPSALTTLTTDTEIGGLTIAPTVARIAPSGGGICAVNNSTCSAMIRVIFADRTDIHDLVIDGTTAEPYNGIVLNGGINTTATQSTLRYNIHDYAIVNNNATESVSSVGLYVGGTVGETPQDVFNSHANIQYARYGEWIDSVGGFYETQVSITGSTHAGKVIEPFTITSTVTVPSGCAPCTGLTLTGVANIANLSNPMFVAGTGIPAGAFITGYPNIAGGSVAISFPSGTATAGTVTATFGSFVQDGFENIVLSDSSNFGSSNTAPMDNWDFIPNATCVSSQSPANCGQIKNWNLGQIWGTGGLGHASGFVASHPYMAQTTLNQGIFTSNGTPSAATPGGIGMNITAGTQWSVSNTQPYGNNGSTDSIYTPSDNLGWSWGNTNGIGPLNAQMPALFLDLTQAASGILSNADYNGTNFVYLNSDFAAELVFNPGGVGGFAAYCAPSGTAGATVVMANYACLGVAPNGNMTLPAKGASLTFSGSSSGASTLVPPAAGTSGGNITLPSTSGTLALASAANVATVSNSDGTLTISPTSGAVVASLALGHANTWTGVQTLTCSGCTLSGVTTLPGSGLITAAGKLAVGGPVVSAAWETIHAGTDQDLLVRGHVTLSAGVYLGTANDAGLALVPLELAGSQFVLSGGNVGIGTGAATPSALLEVNGTTNIDGALTVNSTMLTPNLATSSAATTGTLCWTTGTGNVNVDTTLACLASDERLKSISGPLSGATAEIMALKPIVYSWLDGTPKAANDPGGHLGLGAFATGFVDERLIARDLDGNPRGWRQDAMIALLVRHAQELQQQVDVLTAKLP